MHCEPDNSASHMGVPLSRATSFYTTALCREKEATVHFECGIGRINKEQERRLHIVLHAYGERQDHTVIFPLYWSTKSVSKF